LYEISGQKHEYVRDHGLVIDTVAKSILLTFRLSDSAKTGPWLLQAVAYDSIGMTGAKPMLVPFNVSDIQEGTKRVPFGGIAVMIALVVALGAGLIFVFRKVRPGKTEGVSYSSNPTIRRAQEIISEEISNPALDVELVSEKLKISKSNLSSQFKKETGHSFPQYLNMLRIEKAKELLKTSNLNVSEIAFHVGYGTYEHFNYIFNQYEKIPASEFRKKAGMERLNR